MAIGVRGHWCTWPLVYVAIDVCGHVVCGHGVRAMVYMAMAVVCEPIIVMPIVFVGQ